MSVERAAQYRQKAQECVAQAQRVTSPDDKATWLSMAESWQRLAETAEPRGAMIQVDVDKLPGHEAEISN